MTTTNITIRITHPTPRRRTPRRHVTIPHTALFTQDWWDAQADPSASVRHLIDEDVRVNGMSDVLNRSAPAPVAHPAAATATGTAPFGPQSAAHLASPFTAPASSAVPAAAPVAAATSSAGSTTAQAIIQAVLSRTATPATQPDPTVTELREQVASLAGVLKVLLDEIVVDTVSSPVI